MSTYFDPSENPNKPIKEVADKNFISKTLAYYQAFNDKIQFYYKERWIIAILLALVYLFRTLIYLQGYYAVTYCIGIHVLNSFLGFISPLDDPDENEGEESYLPQRDSEEFRPFERKVKEFAFWETVFWSFFLGFLISFNSDANIPVFWPLLLLYFILIFYITMRKQINHMVKYKYLPWSNGKQRY